MAINPWTGQDDGTPNPTVSLTDPTNSAASAASAPTAQAPQGAAPTAAPQPAPDPTMVKAGASYRGMTPGGMKRSAGLFGGADQAIDNFSQQDNAVTALQQKRNQQDYGNLEKATGTEIDAQKAFQQKDAELQQKIVDFNQHAANVEQQIAGEAKAERAKYLASYQEQLAGVRQFAMQSGNPMGKLSAGGQAGLVGAQFAQGFLAARGIQIDVSGQIDRWVDRSIQEHNQQVSAMRDSANDTLHLYDIARQSSQDDYEARQRYRGFVIAGLQSSVQMNAARFQSDIAIAHAKEQVSKLQIEADQTERTIGDQHFNRVHQMMTTEYDKAFKQGTLAIESQKVDLERQKIDAAKKAQPPPKLPQYIVDSNDVRKDPITGKPLSGGKAVAIYNQDANPGSIEKAQANIQAASQRSELVTNGLDRLRQLKPEGKVWSKWVADMSSADRRAFDAASTELASSIVKLDSGKTVTEQEWKRRFANFADARKWQDGSNDRVWHEVEAAAGNELHATLKSEYQTGTINYLPAGARIDYRYGADENNYMPGVQTTMNPGAQAKDDAYLHGGKPVPSWTEAEVGAASPDQVDRPLQNAGTASSATGVAKLAGNVDKAGPAAPPADHAMAKPSKAYAELVAQSSDEQQPHNTVPVEVLARVFLEPKRSRESLADHGEIPENDLLAQRQAYEALQTIAAGKDPYSSGYAQIMLDKLENDPDGAKALLFPQFGGEYKATRK